MPARISSEPQPLDYRLLTGSAAERENFCREFVDTLRVHGWVPLENHPISTQDVLGMFDTSREFFQLPEELKCHAAHAKDSYENRGWTTFGRETVSAITGIGPDSTKDVEDIKNVKVALTDLKESFDSGREQDPEIPNVWPREVDAPGFRGRMNGFFNSNHQVLLTLLEAMALGLGLPETSFSRHHTKMHHELRLLHYPFLEQDTDRQQPRISSHTDFGSMTLLFQDSVGGLEAERPGTQGTYLPVRTKDIDTMVVMVGDLTTRWTNRQLKATPHRVTIPVPDARESIPERFSVAFFGRPNRDVWIQPLDEFVSDKIPAQYERVKAGDWFTSKQRRLYL